MGMDENNNNNFNNYNINNNSLMYNSENNNNNIIYNSEIDKRSSGYYHDILISKNQKSKSKKRFKFKVLALIVGLFFILSIASLLFFIFFSSAQMTFQGFKFIETKCHLNSTRYIYKNENSNSCQKLNENEWWYEYDKDFYKFTDDNAAINKTTNSDDSNKDESNIVDSGAGGGNGESKSYSGSSSSDSNVELICYQGIFNVYFNNSEGILLNGDIYGLFQSNLNKVQTYLRQIKVDKDQTCFYNKHNTKEIIWIKPPSSFFNIVFIVIIGLIIIVAFVVLVVIFKRAFGPLSNAEEKANLISSQPYYRYTSDKIYNKT